MTREEALEEAIRVYAVVDDWWADTPWLKAVTERWAELQFYGLGQREKVPEEGWTLEGIAHLEGAPERSKK